MTHSSPATPTGAPDRRANRQRIFNLMDMIDESERKGCHAQAKLFRAEIADDSLEPVYSAGDLLFYTRHTHEGVPIEALGRRCVCKDHVGMGWVKLVRAGRDESTFDLHSFNDSTPPMYGVRLKWAAPVRLHWPAADRLDCMG